MKASELRMGNLIYNPIQKINIFVDGGLIATESMREKGLKDYKGFEPIPLTEEWLLRFGFEEYKTEKAINYKKGLIRFTFTNKGKLKGKMFLMIANTIDNKNIKHVHQLQNLYFALTGEELKIK